LRVWEGFEGAGAPQARLAEFMGTEESIIYAYDLATIPSVLPAFANAKDLIVCDEVRARSTSAPAQPPGAAATLQGATVSASGAAVANLA
jgi:hypothetical protein